MNNEDKLIEAIKVLRQTVMEVRAAQNRGPEWYTKGAGGLFTQVRLHLDRASVALKSVEVIIDKEDPVVKVNHKGHLYSFGESSTEVEYLGDVNPFKRVGKELDK